MEVIEPNKDPDLSKRKDIDKVKRDKLDKIIENAWQVHGDTYPYQRPIASAQSAKHNKQRKSKLSLLLLNNHY